MWSVRRQWQALIALALVSTTMVRRGVLNQTDGTEQVPSGSRRVAMISLLLWTGAIVAGRLMAYL